jgi:2-methylcitrate dehydratase PrpD
VETRATEDQSRPAEGYAEVRIHLTDGRQLVRRVDEPRGTPGRPLTLEELAAKYRDCAGRVLSPEGIEGSLELLLGLEQIESMCSLTSLLTAPAGVVA